MFYFRKSLKYNIKEELIPYREKLNRLNTLIKVLIKLNNILYKLAIEIYYSKANGKTKFYFRYVNYYCE